MKKHKLLLDLLETNQLKAEGHKEHGLKIRMEPVALPDKDLGK